MVTQLWRNVKVARDIKYATTIIVILSMILLALTVIKLQGDGGSAGGRISAKGLVILYLSVGVGVPLYLYFHVPGKVKFSDSEMIIKTRWGSIRKIKKSDIHNIRYAKTPVSGEFVYGVQYDIKNPDTALTFDQKSGKAVWDWYYNEGDWKKNS